MFHILLVEDNPTDVRLIREAIRTSSIPAEVTIGSDGEHAIRLLEQFQPDLIILDLNIPKIDGLEVLERSRPMVQTPVVVFTSSDRADEREHALALGVREWIIKPMKLNDYHNAIRGVLERWLPADPLSRHQKANGA